jgi:hypothetical protein
MRDLHGYLGMPWISVLCFCALPSNVSSFVCEFLDGPMGLVLLSDDFTLLL